MLIKKSPGVGEQGPGEPRRSDRLRGDAKLVAAEVAERSPVAATA